MAITFVAAGGQGNTTTDGVSLTLSMPAGLAEDDLLMVFNVGTFAVAGYSGDPWDTPSGWTALPLYVVTKQAPFQDERFAQQVFYKFAGPSEGSVTIDQSGAADLQQWRSIVMAWRGVDLAASFTTETETQYVASGPVVPAASTAKAGLAIILSMQGSVGGSAPGYNTLGSFTQRSPGSYSGSLMRGGVASREDHPGGAVTWPTFDQSFQRDWLFTKVFSPNRRLRYGVGMIVR